MSNTVAASPARFTHGARARRHARATRSRAIAWAEIVALALIVVTLVVATMAGSGRIAENRPSMSVRVERGQTLWSLAAQHPIAGLSTAQNADLIARTNHLAGEQLAVGTTLSIPVEPDTNIAVACR
jgi:hypothetical protein